MITTQPSQLNFLTMLRARMTKLQTHSKTKKNNKKSEQNKTQPKCKNTNHKNNTVRQNQNKT